MSVLIYQHPNIEQVRPFYSEITDHIRHQCQEIYFRQSLIKDYMGCPHRSLYRWIAGFEEESGMFAAFLGTAGHKVIYDIHLRRKYDNDQLWIMEAFEQAFWQEVKDRDAQPRVAKAYASIEEQLHAEMPYYVEILQSYQANKTNQGFHSTIHEQAFVLVIPAQNPEDKPYLFTGQIDQGGYYDDGTFVLRDIKFRDNAFKPSRKELALDPQITTYAGALKFGYPACQACRPRYDLDAETQRRYLRYDGPCDKCKAIIGTPKWPVKYPERCEMIWMFDFELYKKDQYEKEVADNTQPRIANPKGKGPKIYPRIINPKWSEGYKKGDMKGDGILKTWREPAKLSVYLGDITRICDDIREARFFRKPSKDCNWCPYQEACVTSLQIQVQEVDQSQIKTFGTEDPF